MIKFVSYKILKKVHKLAELTFVKLSNILMRCKQLPIWFLLRLKFRINSIFNLQEQNTSNILQL